MSRIADSTIKGFLYQFNKTILTIAEATDEMQITVEGMVEDIDVHGTTGLEAIQCKYHESVDKFVDSVIYKPLLQMAEAFARSPTAVKQFRIFIHAPNEAVGRRSISMSTLDSALNTKDQKLVKIAQRIPSAFNRNAFLALVSIEFGPSLDQLESDVKLALATLQIASADIECLLYPNALALISKLATKSPESDRTIDRASFKKYLSSTNSTAITRWALALKNKDQLLKTVRSQLADGLQHAERKRCFYFDPKYIENFQEDVVNFIEKYIARFHSKPLQLHAPTFAFKSGQVLLNDIELRLFKKDIVANTGMVGGQFELGHFHREPVVNIVKSRIIARDFSCRLVALASGEVINYKKPHDFFFVSDEVPDGLDAQDVTCHRLSVTNFRELEFVLKLEKTYE